MKEYEIWFEIFGKKMKTKIFAVSEDDARNIIRRKIIFHKIEGVEDGLKNFQKATGQAGKDIFDQFADIFGCKK